MDEAQTIRTMPDDTPRAIGSFAERQNGSDGWSIRSVDADAILGPDAPDWFALDGDARAELIKEGFGRATWRVQLADRTVIAKIHECAGFVARLRYRLGITSAHREWRNTLAALTQGVSVPDPIALGRRSGTVPQIVFLSADLEGAADISSTWEQVNGTNDPVGRRRARALIDAIAALFADAHERGFVHCDGHPSNILVRQTSPDCWSAWFIDLDRAKISSEPVSSQSALNAIAQLDQHFHRHASRCCRLRFWKTYWAGRESAAGKLDNRATKRELLGRFDQAVSSNQAQLVKTRDRRLTGNGKYFASMSMGDNWRATAALILERRHMFAEPHVPDRSVSQWRAALNPILREVITGHLDDQSLNVRLRDHGLRGEIMQIRGLVDRWSSTVSGSKHRRAFERCHQSRHRDNPSHLHVACVEHRSGGLIDVTILISPLDSADNAEIVSKEA